MASGVIGGVNWKKRGPCETSGSSGSSAVSAGSQLMEVEFKLIATNAFLVCTYVAIAKDQRLADGKGREGEEERKGVGGVVWNRPKRQSWDFFHFFRYYQHLNFHRPFFP